MPKTRLEEILFFVRAARDRRAAVLPFDEVAAAARRRGGGQGLRSRLRNGPGIIAEVKRASPSRGWIRKDLDAAVQAASYARGGACAVSVVTEERFFGGSLADLSRVVTAVAGLPVLRKDFVLDEYMVAESRTRGADLVLLIVEVLKDRTADLVAAAGEFGLEPLVEVHDEKELELARRAGAEVIGINNRDLRTFNVDPGAAERLLPLCPRGAVKVVESGISSPEQIRRYSELGADAFLVGERLVTADDPAGAIAELLRGLPPAR